MADVTRWITPPAAHLRERGAALAEALGIHPLPARVLVHRGYEEPDAVVRFLQPSLDHLHDPFLLLGMKEAAARLKQAIAAGEKILLYGDYDVDGTCSVVILLKTIELAGGKASFHVPNRLRDGYGMRTEVIDRAAAEGVRLVISADTGIRAQEAVERARAAGIDVIVTDHHLPEDELPAALAILNPKQPGCPYPEKSLCGAGVALKLADGLLREMGWPEERRKRLIQSFLKVAAIATVADVVPLTGENRVIVKCGLEGLADVRNPGLRALLQVTGLAGGVPTAGQVAFRIAPRLNAAGRMASATDVIELLLTSDQERADALAAQLHALNQERQQTESEIIRQILEECTRTPVTDRDRALVFCGPQWHRGVVGIVANRLVEMFHRPVFVLSDEGDGQVQGSGRSLPSFHLLEALESMAGLFTRFGGHKQAAGLTMPAERLEEFRRRMNEYAAARLAPEDMVATFEIDAELELAELTGEAAGSILAMAPFGFGNPAPILAVRGVIVKEAPVVMKDKHLRLRFAQNGKVLPAKAWHFAERAAELARGSKVDILISLEPDAYSASRGYANWSASVRDVRAAD